MTLFSLGWDDFFAKSFHSFCSRDLVPARVALEHKHAYELLSAHGALAAECTGRLLHAAGAEPGRKAASRADLPAVGDWVAVRLRPGEARADIHAVLARKTKFSRRAAGDNATEQIVAANVDTVLLVTALDHNYNLRRIERYLAVAWESGAQPVVVLNKADLHPDPTAAQAQVARIASGAPVLIVTALPPRELSGVPIGTAESRPENALAPWLGAGRTVALLGSSGVGKSTLINRLLGAPRQATQAISDAEGRAQGRHTTTQRELIVTPSGAIVIDTPGMRELQLWDLAAATLDTTFTDIAMLAAHCRFSDCTHGSEPGCAVQTARDDGTLDAGRWQSFQKLQREQAYAARKADPRLERATKATWKKLHKAQRETTKEKDKEARERSVARL